MESRRSFAGGSMPGPGFRTHGASFSAGPGRSSNADLLFFDVPMPAAPVSTATTAPAPASVPRPAVAQAPTPVLHHAPVVISAPVVGAPRVGVATVLFDYRKQLPDEIDLYMHEKVRGLAADACVIFRLHVRLSCRFCCLSILIYFGLKSCTAPSVCRLCRWS